MGLGVFDRCLVVEELSRACSGITLATTATDLGVGISVHLRRYNVDDTGDML